MDYRKERDIGDDIREGLFSKLYKQFSEVLSIWDLD